MSSINKIDITLTGKETWDDWVHAVGGVIPAAIWKAISPTNRTTRLFDLPDRPEPSDVDQNANSYKDLSISDQQALRMELDFWKEQNRLYEKQQKDIEQVYTLLFSSVSPVLQEGLDRSQSLSQWIDYLRNKAEPTDGFMINKMKSEYKAILRSFRGLKSLSTWLDDWETFMVKATRYDLPDLDGGNWLLDLSILIEPIHQTYSTSFREAASSLIQQKREQHKKMARLIELTDSIRIDQSLICTPSMMDKVNQSSSLSKEITRLHIDPTGTGEWSVGKVASKLKDWSKDLKNRSGSGLQRGTAFHTAEDNSDDEKPEKPRAKRPRKEQQDNNPSKKQATNCSACGAPFHTLEKCWVAIPEIRPDYAKVSKERINQVNKTISQNPTLKAKVDKIRASAKKEAIDNRITELE